jgi:ABC-2 type transport system ATP-binding protein
VGDLDFRLLSRQCCRIRSGPFISSFFKKKIMSAILSVQNLSKQYDGGFQASTSSRARSCAARPQRRRQDDADLHHLRARDAVRRERAVGGHDVVDRLSREPALIGLVPQELTLEVFATLRDTVAFSRGLFGLRRDPARIEQILGSSRSGTSAARSCARSRAA